MKTTYRCLLVFGLVPLAAGVARADEITDWNQTMLRAALIRGTAPQMTTRVADAARCHAGHPEYPSAYSCLSAAAGAVLANRFGDRTDFTVESDQMPGVVRSFKSFTPALDE